MLDRQFKKLLLFIMWFKIDKGLAQEITSAAKKTINAGDSFDPEIRISDPKFSDFQANGIFSFAKSVKKNPRELAQKVVDELQNNEIFKEYSIETSIAGPGFINIKLSNKFLAEWIKTFRHKEDFSVAAKGKLSNQTIVIDYSSPNTAKQMHVGHLRSMNIGESIQRILKFFGANVIRDNHIGDWGTQFGVLIVAIKHFGINLDEISPDQAIETLEDLYKRGNELTKQDKKYLANARNELIKLQNYDEENFLLWEKINEISYKSFHEIYKQMDISFDYVLGESFYNDKINQVYDELTSTNIATNDNQALVVFHPEHERFKDQPFIIRKSDGASNYATTDLATVLYRVEKLHADEIIYVTDGRQQDHFQQLFLTVKKWFAATNRKMPELKHVWFGTILGKDGKAIKTRSGTSVKLKELITEATERAQNILQKKISNLNFDEQQKTSEIIGIDSIKYSDLMSNRTNDYIFAFDKMVSFEGNTAAYLLYASTRIRSIFNKLNISIDDISCDFKSDFETAEERALALKISFFPMILSQVIDDLRPHYLCNYLFGLTCEYSTFYSANKVISDDKNVQNRRLLLCTQTLNILEIGFNLLGLKTINKM